MKVYKLSLNEYEHLRAMRDQDNIALPMTNYILQKFKGNLRHKYNVHSEFTKTDPGSYKCFTYTITFEDDSNFTWFMLNL